MHTYMGTYRHTYIQYTYIHIHMIIYSKYMIHPYKYICVCGYYQAGRTGCDDGRKKNNLPCTYL